MTSLVQKQQLSEGDRTLELKAFESVLPKGSRLSKSQSYPVGTFNSQTLSDEEYKMSEQERQQVAFLEQLL